MKTKKIAQTPLERGLIKALKHKDCVRDRYGLYYTPNLALLRIENVLRHHGIYRSSR